MGICIGKIQQVRTKLAVVKPEPEGSVGKAAEEERKRCVEEGRPALHSLVKLSGMIQFEVQLCTKFPTRQTQASTITHSTANS